MQTLRKIRHPTLADRLLAERPNQFSVLDKHWVERHQSNLRTAKKFVLDGQAATYLGNMIKEHPRIIADAQDFAIPPFERMWVELPFRPFFTAITGKIADATSDFEVGYLFSGPTVVVGASVVDWKTPALLPVEYWLHRPMPVDEQFKVAHMLGISRLGLDVWFWGESALQMTERNLRENTAVFDEQGNECTDGAAYRMIDKAVKSMARGELDRAIAELKESDERREVEADERMTWTYEGLRALRANHSASVPGLKKHAQFDPTNMRAMINAGNGDLRNIIALLLFLNRTKDIQYEREEPMQQSFIRRQPRPLMPHRVITLKLDPAPRLMKLVAGMSGIKRRLHDVRGHYCHDHTARESGCLHGLDRMGDFGDWWFEYEPLRWDCCGCGGKRWWRREHHRGSADIGIIREQTYAVTT